jgi:hypothetical protein
MVIEFKGEEGTVEYNEERQKLYVYHNKKDGHTDVEYCNFMMTSEEFAAMIECFATDKVRKMYNIAWKELNTSRIELEGILKTVKKVSELLDSFEGLVEAEEKKRGL